MSIGLFVGSADALSILLFWHYFNSIVTGNFNNKMKYNKHHTVGKVQKSNRKIVERGRIDSLTHNNTVL